MMKLLLLFATFGALGPFVQPLIAQDSSPGNEEAIVVEGVRIEQEVGRLAREVTRHSSMDKPLPRFFGPICIAVAGMQPELAYTLIERMEANAHDIGIGLDSEGCSPNVLVVFVKNAEETIQGLYEEYPSLLGSLRPFEVRDMINQAESAAAWHSTEIRNSDGTPVHLTSFLPGGGELPFAAKVNSSSLISRASLSIRNDMTAAVVLINREAALGKTVQQLADYATMRAFADTESKDGDDQPSSFTILSLFEETESPPQGLTAFDKLYLKEIYGSQPNARPGSVIYSMASKYVNE